MIALRQSSFLPLCFCVASLSGSLQSCSPPDDPPPENAPQRAALVDFAVYTVSDSYLRFGSANRNYGEEFILRLQSSGNNRALVRMDQADIDAAVGMGTLISATLRLPISYTATNWGDERAIIAHRLTTAWTELGVAINCFRRRHFEPQRYALEERQLFAQTDTPYDGYERPSSDDSTLSDEDIVSPLDSASIQY